MKPPIRFHKTQRPVLNLLIQRTLDYVQLTLRPESEPGMNMRGGDFYRHDVIDGPWRIVLLWDGESGNLTGMTVILHLRAEYVFSFYDPEIIGDEDTDLESVLNSEEHMHAFEAFLDKKLLLQDMAAL